jgi:NAD(P) transhydrogenase subunit alpha
MKVSVVKETAPGERRVALVPEAVVKLRAAGLDVLVESGAGEGAWLTDDAYAEAGASVVSRADALTADVVLMVGRPDAATVAALRPGQAVIGLLSPLTDPDLVRSLADAGVVALSMDMIPRTLPRAQPMDALSSQANIAGYKAALVAAAEFGRFFPMLITAAGTARPARVLVLGVGVAGLQAIGTARRLGALVSAYDVRPETRTEAESVGATFIELSSVGPASGEGGYARALTDDERVAQQQELASHIARHDVVITTATARNRGRAEGDDGRIGHRGHGCERSGGQRCRLRSRPDGHHRARRHDHRRISTAVEHVGRCLGHVRPQRERAAAVPDQGRRARAGSRRRTSSRRRDHVRRRSG